jgi:hypothetical protein
LTKDYQWDNNTQEDNMDCNDELKIALKKYRQMIITPSNTFLALDAANSFISLWNPLVGAITISMTKTIQLGANIHSCIKANERIKLIIETIEKIIVKQNEGRSNYEASLICPELFRNAMIYEDIDRVKEHLLLIESIFSSGKIDFDEIHEALRIVNQISSIEYKILKLMPLEETQWIRIIENKLIYEIYDKDIEKLTSIFLSLINMNLIIRKTPLRIGVGPEYGIINFHDELELTCLSIKGKLFLETIGRIKNA